MSTVRLSEMKSELRTERRKLQSLMTALTQSQEISGKIADTTSKTERCLKTFENELEPLFVSSSDLKRKMHLTEEALKKANSNLDYIQNAKELESILRSKIKQDEIDEYLECADRAFTIKNFTEGESSNEFYLETHHKMRDCLEHAEENLTELFTELLRQLSLHQDVTEVEQTVLKLKKVHGFAVKLGSYQHYSAFLISREKRFAEEMDSFKSKIKDMSISNTKQYSKGDHPLVEAFEKLHYTLETDTSLSEELFEDQAREVLAKVAEGEVREFLHLIQIFEGTMKSLEKKTLFLVILDLLDSYQAERQSLKEILSVTSFDAIEGKCTKLSEIARTFFKNYQKEIFNNQSKPTNEKIAENTIELVRFWHELKLYENGIKFIAKFEPLGSSVLSMFVDSINNKRKGLKTKNPIHPSLFMMNNIFFIQNKIENFELQDLFSDNDLKQLEGAFAEELTRYLQAIWSKIISFELKIESEKGELKKSSKKDIKKFFEEFNSATLEFQKSHKEIWIADSDLAERLKDFLKGRVLKKYLSVVSSVSDLSYAKDRSKYQKLEPSEFKEIIEAVFHMAVEAPDV